MQNMHIDDKRRKLISPTGAQMTDAGEFENRRNGAMSPPSHMQQHPKMQQQQQQDFGREPTPQQIPTKQAPIDVDNQVLPAMTGAGAGNPPQEYENDQGPNMQEMEAEPITGENAINAEPLIRFFGEEHVRKIFSKTWQNRDNGIKALED